VKFKFDSVLTVTLVLCALFTTGAVVRREFWPATNLRAEQKPVYVKDWQSHLAAGMRMGPAEAPIQMMEFADFECPFCGSLHKTIKAVRERYPTQVAVTFIHFPLPNHRFALPAARVAECAGVQGRFEAMHDRLFEEQDGFGLKPWSDYATEARVPDGTAFDDCIKHAESPPRVAEGEALGKLLDVQGTPTVIIKGWRLGRPPSEPELDAMVKAVLAGNSPVTG